MIAQSELKKIYDDFRNYRGVSLDGMPEMLAEEMKTLKNDLALSLAVW